MVDEVGDIVQVKKTGKIGIITAILPKKGRTSRIFIRIPKQKKAVVTSKSNLKPILELRDINIPKRFK